MPANAAADFAGTKIRNSSRTRGWTFTNCRSANCNKHAKPTNDGESATYE
jgi:hypothetical protein